MHGAFVLPVKNRLRSTPYNGSWVLWALYGGRAVQRRWVQADRNVPIGGIGGRLCYR